MFLRQLSSKSLQLRRFCAYQPSIKIFATIDPSEYDKLMEWDLLSFFQPDYSNPSRLVRLQREYNANIRNTNATLRYMRELNRNRRYELVKELYIDSQSTTSYDYQNSNIEKLSIQNEYAMMRIAGQNQLSPKSRSFFFMALQLVIVVCTYVLYKAITAFRGAGKPSDLVEQMLGGKTKVEKEVNVQTRFSDVLGIDEFKEELTEIVDFLKNPQKYTQMGAKLPKGLLLVGPPGTGKTLLARALAGEAGCSFFYKAGAQFDEMFVGVGPSRVRKLFEAAREAAPSIIFIDEIDSAAGKRSSLGSNHTRDTLNQLLAQMDGFNPSDNVLVIGATNMEQALDSAIKRPGRFDKIIHVPLPDIRGRKQILQHYLKKISFDASIDTNNLARRTTGFSGADIQNMVNVAILNAVRNGKIKIKQEKRVASRDDFQFAYDRIKMGVGRKNMVVSAEDRKMTAFHQIGHALTAMLTEGATPVHKVTILPRGGALGFTATVPNQDNLHMTKQAILASIDVAMGGRASQEIFFGNDQITTGCSDDLKKATNLAYLYVAKLGMNQKLNLVSASDEMLISDEYRYSIDKEVDRILKQSYIRVKHLLQSNKSKIRNLTAELIQRQTLSSEELEQIMNKSG